MNGHDKGSKISRLEALKQVEKTLKRTPDALKDAPKPPPELVDLWGFFVALKNSSDGPISYTEIQAYAELTGNDLAPWEVEAIKMLDQVFIREQAKQWQS